MPNGQHESLARYIKQHFYVNIYCQPTNNDSWGLNSKLIPICFSSSAANYLHLL